jgi:TPR repeat protein/putative methionine-R-sulfoxide reductase with GAF domain
MAAIVQASRPSSSNRRGRVRQKVHVPAYARFAGNLSNTPHDLCEVLNISDIGLALQCPSPLQVDQIVDLHLNLAEGGREILATARVAWLSPSGRIGFHLSIHDDSAVSRLHEWLLLNALAAAANAGNVAPSSSNLYAQPEEIPLRQNYTDALSAASAVQKEAEALGSDLEAVLALVARRSLSLLRSSGAAIALAGKEPDTMICRASAGDNTPPVGVTLQVGSGFSGDCVRSGKLSRCDDTETDPRVDRETCRSLGIRSILAIPLRAADNSIGLIEVFSPDPRAYGENDNAVLQRFGEIVLGALNRAMPSSGAASQSQPAPKPFTPAPGSVLFAHAPEEASDYEKKDNNETKDQSERKDYNERNEKKESVNEDVVGGIRLPRSHLVLLISAAATIFLALGFLSAPWIQPWVQQKLQNHTPTVEQTVLASSQPPATTDSSIDTANPSQLRELANHGDPAAENAMGLLYSSGDDKQGIVRDENEAARWFTKAAEHGNVPAQSKLGSLYWSGRGVAKDDNRAYFWTVLARASGDDASKVLAPFIATRLTPPQRTAIEQQAEQWLQQHETRTQAQNVR